MIEEEDFWVLPIKDRQVTQCRIDYAFGLELWESEENNYSIRITGEFRLIRGKEEIELDPASSDPTQVGLALSILHHRILVAKAYKKGDLELQFDSGEAIYVPSGDQYESWEISGPGGFLLVGLSGDLAIWKPKESKNDLS